MKKKTIHLLSKSLLTKLALVVALFLGNVSLAVADTAIFDGSGDIVGWTKNGVSCSTYGTRYLYTSADNKTLTSDSPITIGSNQKLVISVRGYLGTSTPAMEVKYSSDKVDWSTAKSFDGENIDNSNYGNLEIDNISGTSYYIQIVCSQIRIGAITVVGEADPATTPVLSLSTASLNFGSLRANGKQTVTVTNEGVGTMDVNIAFKSATTDFTLSKTSLTGIGANKSETFEVNFLYDSSDLGLKNATITVTPSYDNAEAIDIAVTATASDPNVWEDFSEGIPATWFRSNSNFWIAADGRARGTSASGYYLRTPRLLATSGAKVSFDVEPQASSTLKAEYSTDCINWTTIDTYSESGNKSFSAAADGYYWLRFSGKGYVDNFAGWTVATPVLDMLITSQTLSDKGTIHGEYTATLNILERGGVGETVNVELYFGDENVAGKTNYAISGNSDNTIELSYTPTEEWTGQAYFKVIGANIGTIESGKVNVEITEPEFVLNEDVDISSSKPTCSNAVIKLKYTPKAGWNTIVMPFSLTDYLDKIFGSDCVAYKFTNYDNGTLSFTKYSSLDYSTPYLVYAPNAVAHPEGVYLTNVTVSSYLWTSSNLSQKKGDASFKGTFAPMAAGSLTGKYGVTNAGGIAKAGAGASMKGYRAYLELPSGATARILVIDEEGETTDLGFVKLVDQEAKAVYNLSGQRVEKGRKGLYIVNGKKVVVK